MKTAKKGICLVLALVLCLGLFAACGGNGDENGYANGDNGDDRPAQADGMLAGIDAKTVVIEIDGMPVLWEEFFFDLQSVRQTLEFQGFAGNWDDIFEDPPLYSGEMTYNEFAIRFATDQALERRAIRTFFTEELGETLDPGLYEASREDIMLAQGLDEAGFHDLLTEHFLTEDAFRFIDETMTMYGQALEAYSAEASDESVAAVVESEGILRAKHILIMIEQDHDHHDHGPDEVCEVDDEEATAKALELYEELAALSGEEQLARFNEMMETYGEDPGMEMNPGGYTFVEGVMVPEFTEGTMELELYEISPPIRSQFGYHIILRLPVEREAEVMGIGSTVEVMAAGMAFEQRITEIQEGLDYTITPLLETMVPGEIFALIGGAAFDSEEDEDFEQEE